MLGPSGALVHGQQFLQRINSGPRLKITSSAAISGGQNDGVESVAIVGGGFGGLAAAVALRRRGIEAKVYEKSPPGEGRGAGTMIGLSPNGVWALSECNPDIVPMLKEGGVANPVAISLSPDGKLNLRNELSSAERKYGFPVVSIRWRKVLDILESLLPSDQFHADHELIDIKQNQDYVTAVFNTPTGLKEVKAKVLIGADGIRSKVRNTVFGHKEPRDNGRWIWRGIIPFDRLNHPDLTPKSFVTIIGGGRTATIVDCGHNGLYWVYAVRDEVEGEQAKFRSRDSEEAKKRLLAQFQGWNLAYEVLEATKPEEILERRVLDLPVMDTWVKGRVMLLGDACHAVTPTLGQGANQAFEDALELATQLANAPDERAAMDEYQRIRIPRAKMVSALSTNTAKKVYSGGDGNPQVLLPQELLFGYKGQGSIEVPKELAGSAN